MQQSVQKNLLMIIICTYGWLVDGKYECIVLSVVEERDHYDYQQQERCRRHRDDRQTFVR